MTKLMYHYYWEGINRLGEKITGVIEAPSTAFAKLELGKQGIVVRKLVKKREPFFKKNKKIRATDIAIFSRQLATLVAAGIPLLQAFTIIHQSQQFRAMQNLLKTIQNDIESGLTFAEALRKHPLLFNALFCNLIDAGEKSGTLETMLSKIAFYKEKIEIMKRKVKKALIYPAIVLILVCAITFALLMFVIPQFEVLFKEFDAQLPALTQTVINLSTFFHTHYFFSITAMVSILYGFIFFQRYSKKFKYRLDYYLLKAPLIGNIIQKSAIARFSRTLAITFAAGLPLIEALQLIAGVTGNVLYANATERIREEICNGQPMQIAIENTNLFPHLVVQMVAVGEASGALENMLSKIADFYEEEVDNVVDNLSRLLEPMIMVILGLIVGGLVIAMYLPIFKLGAVV